MSLEGRRPGALLQAEIEGAWLDTVLLVAVVGPLATFVILAVSGPPGDRYLVAAVVFAGVLTGRSVAQAWQHLEAVWAKRAVMALGAAVSLCCAAGLGYIIAQPRPPLTVSALAAFLEDHHLRNGVGDYWLASITTVETGMP